ncbi:MAG: DUF2867 domain-containing protein [Phycisphaera sp.]|nr:DUF2867 domain-containing protein [Phycisphaera sp.]
MTGPLSRGCVLLTGATGYIGGRLAPRLLDAGWRVRCLTRSRSKLAARPWTDRPGVEVVECDASDVERMTKAMRGCVAAYYLIHSMEVAGREYAQRDRMLAQAFAAAAARAGVGRIIYLGGLGEMGDNLSEHLSSRREVEERLASTGVPVTVFRAAMVIGSGSASFEVLRYLTERLPIMVTPRWVQTESQPIAVRDVLRYLSACLDHPETLGQTLDIGGPDIVTYRQMIHVMAHALRLRRRVILPVPLLTPRLSSLWVHLVTPVNYKVARPLADGLRNRVVCRDNTVHKVLGEPELDVKRAVMLAVGRVEREDVETSWSDAGVMPGDPGWAGGQVFTDRREVVVHADAQRTFETVCKLGGEHGYYEADWLWHLRGVMDRLVGGPGLRRSRRNPRTLSVGDALDFWRVIQLERGQRVSLRAEMKVPGDALLEFEVHPLADDNDSQPSERECLLVQTARFKPRGLLGLLYWYAVLPMHGYVFRSMLNGLKREAEQPPKQQG